MVKAAAAKGWIDNKKIRRNFIKHFNEQAPSVILTYFAKEWALDNKKSMEIPQKIFLIGFMGCGETTNPRKKIS